MTIFVPACVGIIIGSIGLVVYEVLWTWLHGRNLRRERESWDR